MPLPPRVRLAPNSLALVLCPSKRGLTEPGGPEVLRLFQEANGRSFWDPRLVAAVNRVFFQGWLRGAVLLVLGESGDLEELKEAWARRALRAPRGYSIRAVGDVSPVHMSPVPQSQFIPLTEVLCCTISDMNADHVVVTQDALMETLLKHHPGMATPPQDVLYSTLGNLIKERKIYHTGEGYFIVTPQTYFITNNGENDNKWHVSEDNPPLSPCVTYLVSMTSCTDMAKGNLPTVSHCPSCHCYSDPLMLNVPEQSLIIHEQKDTKVPHEQAPWIQTCAVTSSVAHSTCEQSKPSVSMKQREKCSRKFVLGLFRRTLSKKEKSKKQYTTFAAQFPPEEWPVRDEDNVDNIPRDIEHEIIKRINPVLTVDNLVKHTVLMQKAERQKKYFSKGTSTEVLTARQKHYPKTGLRKKINKSTQHRKILQVGKEKYLFKNQKELLVEESVPSHDYQREHLPVHPSCVNNSSLTLKKQFKTKNALNGESHCIYKKRIDNPFQGAVPSPRAHQKCEMRKPRSGKEESSDQRSRSLDFRTAKCISNEEKHSNVERLTIESKEYNPFPIKCVTVNILKYPSSYRDSTEDPCKPKHFGEYPSNLNLTCVKPPNERENRQNKALMNDDVLAGNQKEAIKHPQTSKGTYPYDGPSVLYGLAQKTASHCHTVGIFDKFRLVEKITVPNQAGEPKHSISTDTACSELIDTACEGCADDDLSFYEKDVQDDVCSSLYLEENDSDENLGMRQVLHGHIHHMFTDTWDISNKKVAQTTGIPNSWNRQVISPQYSGEVHSFDLSYVKERNRQSDLQETLTSSQCQGLNEEMYLQNETSPSFYEKTDDGSLLNEHLQVSNIVDASIFDYYNESDMGSQAEVLQKSSNEIEEKSVCWSSDQQTEEMREHFEQNFKLFNTAHHTVMPSGCQREPNRLEGTENLSNTGDSGIDSPRARISLASSNSIILDGLKRRSILPNTGSMNANSKGTLSKKSLLQLTPVINV
ncbi:storkhead-box protein 1 isoform X1 [Pleurodeles waltl]|uniref:storkhead-box protein 1 isoform X1 n=2 Tax=Pleurodeles waltl TaxID=8319 RepID=UPI00370941D5